MSDWWGMFCLASFVGVVSLSKRDFCCFPSYWIGGNPFYLPPQHLCLHWGLGPHDPAAVPRAHQGWSGFPALKYMLLLHFHHYAIPLRVTLWASATQRYRLHSSFILEFIWIKRGWKQRQPAPYYCNVSVGNGFFMLVFVFVWPAILMLLKLQSSFAKCILLEKESQHSCLNLWIIVWILYKSTLHVKTTWFLFSFFFFCAKTGFETRNIWNSIHLS